MVSLISQRTLRLPSSSLAQHRSCPTARCNAAEEQRTLCASADSISALIVPKLAHRVQEPTIPLRVSGWDGLASIGSSTTSTELRHTEAETDPRYK